MEISCIRMSYRDVANNVRNPHVSAIKDCLRTIDSVLIKMQYLAFSVSYPALCLRSDHSCPPLFGRRHQSTMQILQTSVEASQMREWTFRPSSPVWYLVSWLHKYRLGSIKTFTGVNKCAYSVRCFDKSRIQTCSTIQRTICSPERGVEWQSPSQAEADAIHV